VHSRKSRAPGSTAAIDRRQRQDENLKSADGPNERADCPAILPLDLPRGGQDTVRGTVTEQAAATAFMQKH